MRKALAICSMLAATGAGMLAPSARADHSCDALGEPGWSTVPSHEIVHVADGPPYQAGGDWLVDRTTTVLPTVQLHQRIRQLQPALLFAQSGGQDRAGDDLPGQRGRRALCGAVPTEVVPLDLG